MKVLVVIPAFNAANSLPGLLSAVKNQIQDVIVIDDGSIDNTSIIAGNSGASVVRHESNRGKGAALRTGFAHAIENAYDAVITIDADMQHNPDDIPRFIEAFRKSGADLIIGSRVRDKGQMPWDRRFSNWITSRFLSALLKRKIEDSQCGYRLISRRLLESLSFESDRFELESEIIIKATRAGLAIDFVPIRCPYEKTRRSNIRRLTDTFRWCRMVIRSI